MEPLSIISLVDSFIRTFNKIPRDPEIRAKLEAAKQEIDDITRIVNLIDLILDSKYKGDFSDELHKLSIYKDVERVLKDCSSIRKKLARNVDNARRRLRNPRRNGRIITVFQQTIYARPWRTTVIPALDAIVGELESKKATLNTILTGLNCSLSLLVLRSLHMADSPPEYEAAVVGTGSSGSGTSDSRCHLRAPSAAGQQPVQPQAKATFNASPAVSKAGGERPQSIIKPKKKGIAPARRPGVKKTSNERGKGESKEESQSTKSPTPQQTKNASSSTANKTSPKGRATVKASTTAKKPKKTVANKDKGPLNEQSELPEGEVTKKQGSQPLAQCVKTATTVKPRNPTKKAVKKQAAGPSSAQHKVITSGQRKAASTQSLKPAKAAAKQQQAAETSTKRLTEPSEEGPTPAKKVSNGQGKKVSVDQAKEVLSESATDVSKKKGTKKTSTAQQKPVKEALKRQKEKNVSNTEKEGKSEGTNEQSEEGQKSAKKAPKSKPKQAQSTKGNGTAKATA